MDDLLLLARGLLALLFAFAAVTKLANLASFRGTLLDFGVPPAAVGAGAVAVPAAEVAVAALLLPASTAVAAAVGAVALLGAFCVAIALVLRRGDERPDCGCFGADRPVGPRALARNAALAGVAALIALGGGGAALSSIDAAPLSVALAIAVVVQAWFGWQLFRQHGRLLERVGALERATSHPHAGGDLKVLHRRRTADQRLRGLEH